MKIDRQFITKFSLGLFWPSIILSMIVLFTPVSGSGGVKYLDKLVHFIMFAWLTWSALHKFQHRFWIGSILVSYIGFAEIIQEYFIPGRGLDIYDVVAGLIGLIFSFLVIGKFNR